MAKKEKLPKEKKEKAKKKRRWRFGDRRDGRKVRSLAPMNYVSPYIMPTRAGASNYIRDCVDTEVMDEYIYAKRKEGYKGFGTIHVFISAYVRMISQRPGTNRFINRQKIYARNNIEIMMVVKKELSLNSKETIVKLEPNPAATAPEIYTQFSELVEKNRAKSNENNFDNTAKVLSFIPGLLLKFTVWFLKLLDYFDLLPRFLTKLSPFHGTMFITSMGSLGIPPIYHHLYELGNVPTFLAYGAKRTQNELSDEGEVVKKKYIDFTFVCDERICDGHYYASALKLFREYLKNPWLLDEPPAQVVEDVD